MSNNVYQPVGGIKIMDIYYEIHDFYSLHKTLRPKGLGRRFLAFA